MFSLFKKRPKSVPLEQQLAVLGECGIRMRPGRSVEELLVSFDREQYERDPYLLLVTMLGGEVEDGDGAGERFSDDAWRFDAECIEDHGDYIRIAASLAALSGGALPIDDLRDHVDIEKREAWVSFRLDGRQHRWDADVNDDWIDLTILSRFARLLESRGGERRFAIVDTGGQDAVLLCITPEQLSRVRKRTGLKVQWLA